MTQIRFLIPFLQTGSSPIKSYLAQKMPRRKTRIPRAAMPTLDCNVK
jgi:hypothetical protein